MDQKRAMLYPDIDPAHQAATHEHRISASAAMGLPAEAPPSYDIAIASTSTPTPAPAPAPRMSAKSGGSGGGGASSDSAPLGWRPSAPSTALATPEPTQGTSQHAMQQPEVTAPQTRPVIVVQPLPQQQPPVTNSVPTKLGPNPCAVTCPTCGACKTTRMVFTPNTRTHVCAGLLCLAGWCCCACFVPYFMNSCRTGNHYCSQCNTFLGVYSPRRARKHHR